MTIIAIIAIIAILAIVTIITTTAIIPILTVTSNITITTTIHQTNAPGNGQHKGAAAIEHPTWKSKSSRRASGRYT